MLASAVVVLGKVDELPVVPPVLPEAVVLDPPVLPEPVVPDALEPPPSVDPVVPEALVPPELPLAPVLAAMVGELGVEALPDEPVVPPEPLLPAVVVSVPLVPALVLPVPLVPAVVLLVPDPPVVLPPDAPMVVEPLVPAEAEAGFGQSGRAVVPELAPSVPVLPVEAPAAPVLPVEAPAAPVLPPMLPPDEPEALVPEEPDAPPALPPPELPDAKAPPETARVSAAATAPSLLLIFMLMRDSLRLREGLAAGAGRLACLAGARAVFELCRCGGKPRARPHAPPPLAILRMRPAPSVIPAGTPETRAGRCGPPRAPRAAAREGPRA